MYLINKYVSIDYKDPMFREKQTVIGRVVGEGAFYIVIQPLVADIKRHAVVLSLQVVVVIAEQIRGIRIVSEEKAKREKAPRDTKTEDRPTENP